MSAAPPSLAVIGAGVAGSALAARLRQLGWRGWIGLWEAGRGPGGRASTRRSRHDPGLHIDHGAPLFNITGSQPPRLLADLRSGGWIEPWTGRAASFDPGGLLRQPGRDPLLAGALWHGCGGMDRIAHGLLEIAEEIGPVERHWGHRVRQPALRPGGGWRLFNDDGEELAEVDWLVLSGSLLAHPRCQALLGWEAVPLREVADAAADPQLSRSVRVLGAMGWQARCNLLMVIPAELAGPWTALPFQLLNWEQTGGDSRCLPIPQRLSIQPLEDGRCAVVAHAGARQIAAANQDSERNSLFTALEERLTAALAPWISPSICREALRQASVQVMRWGAAFAEPPGLQPEMSLCPASRIGFCGDYIAGPGFGRMEGSLNSAENLAEALIAAAAQSGGHD